MKLLKGFPKGVHTLSVTQLKLWQSCPRAWGFRYIMGIKAPQSDSQRLGSRVHAILEEWLRHGTPPDPDETLATAKGLKYPGRIAVAGLPLLPAPPQHYVEEKFWLELEPGVVIYGLIDLRPEGDRGDGPVEVVDHKTSTDFKWAMTKTQLLDDTQAVVYGMVGCLKTGRDTARSRWVYYRTAGQPASMTVSALQYREELERKVNDLLPLARTILAAKDIVKDVNELDFSPSHCGAYGGCPHRDRCNISPRERLVASMNVNDFVNAQLEKQGQTPPPAPTEAPPPPPPPPAQTEAPPPPPAAPAPSKPAKGDPPVESFDPNDLTTWSRQQLKDKAVDQGLLTKGSRHGRAAILTMLAPAGKETTVEVPPAAPHSETTEELEEPPPPSEPSTPLPTEVTLPPVDLTPVALDGLFIGNLYVDCIPYQDATVVPLSKLVAQALEGLGFEDDYRIEPENGYGKAAGVLSAAVERIVRDQGPMDIFASTRYAEHRDCLAMLEGLAERIIKGV